MEYKQISELTEASTVNDADLLVAQQDGAAVSMTAGLLKTYIIGDINTATEADFSAWPAFTLTVNGMPQEGAAELDDAGRPTAITLNGHTLTLKLPEVE